MRLVLMIAVFFTIAAGGMWAMFAMVHGKEAARVPTLKLPSVDIPQRLPELPELATEPAQAPGSGVHKCIGKGGSVTYTDEPCPLGQREHALDPQRSRISTVQAPKTHSTATAAPPAAPGNLPPELH